MDEPRAVIRESSAGFQLAKSRRKIKRTAIAAEKPLYKATGFGELGIMPESDSSTSLVAIIMGSKSDWETMRQAAEMLDELGVPNEAHVLSAHRTPDATADFARKAADRGIRVIIAGAGGAAHLAGVIAAYTWLPVLGVPIQSQALHGLDSLLSIAQMPGGIPVGTLAIGSAGAKNSALLAASIIGLNDENVRANLQAFRQKQTDTVLSQRLP
jgi:5-(carboxyamino)imidazole ribonucleotide mutase